MSTHMTKTWFVDGQIIEQEIPESEIYKRQPLPIEEINRLWVSANQNSNGAVQEFARAIEAAHGIGDKT